MIQLNENVQYKINQQRTEFQPNDERNVHEVRKYISKTSAHI